MASTFYNAVAQEISELGFEYWKNAKGSQEKWKSRHTGKILLLPRNLKSRHTANAILKSAGSIKKL